VPNPAKSSAPALSNFAHLQAHDEQLLRLGMLAERYFAEDPNTCLLKLRQLAELLTQMVAANAGLFERVDEGQYELLNRLRDRGIMPYEIHQLFGEVRRTGNAANHALAGDYRTALATLKITWQLGVWFHRTFRAPQFKSGPFVPPRPPADETQELRAELDSLARELMDYRTTHQEAAQQLETLQQELKAAKDDQSFWESMASEAEVAKAALQARLAAKQADAAFDPPRTATIVQASAAAATSLELDESATRTLIDAQLRQAGWTADSEVLRYSKGARPQKGKNLAIAEWPTANGPADYVLFAGLVPLAAVEAKRKNVNVSGSLQQAKRYSRGFEASDEVELHEQNWGAESEFRLPFVFSTNGRPWLRQLSTHSGIWFCDLRRPDNLADALQGWLTPEGLLALFKQDAAAAHERLAEEAFDYGFTVRDYQQAAILATEQAIGEGRRSILLAMATGTGKTKTCIALIYRLLKTKRFRRILFLVDRSALGEQAANAFKETRMESLQTFADIFGIKELDEQKADSDTCVHLATVQGMVQRVLYPGEHSLPPVVDEYDCIIIDECHRGYLLDRELSETELSFRSFGDYVSKYRRVIDYFAAVKIGLTATPALHTTEIFGAPVYSYSYREAVIDGHLVDHDPPVQIRTELSEDGIGWNRGDEIGIFNPRAHEIELFQAPDEINFNVEDFNRKVITEPFNRVVCEYLASEIDPASPHKSLIFCANDVHADLVVKLLKLAFREAYGTVDDDAVMKITGTADKPLKLIRRYKNERTPSVAVTVDLLTTGIDVPAICNLVFLRRVNSRILFDQMLGRATRQCPEIGKETFRIFDAVRLYEALQALTAMTAVVVDPSISFVQLEGELAAGPGEEATALIRDQFVAKLQRKKRHLGETGDRDFEVRAGMSPDAFIRELRAMPLDQVAAWFIAHPGLGEILDRKGGGPVVPIFISSHEDRLREAEPGYGNARKPEDYIQGFAAFINSKANEIPALITVLTRPRDLTRRDLKELSMLLDNAGYSDASLSAAWRQMTNRDVAARIIGFIRQAALGDPLVPFRERVDHALQSILASRPWTGPQRDWLKKLAAQTTANLLVDRAALDDPNLIFKREGGGFPRLDKIFGGELQQVLDQFNESVWERPA
jgi:type I restriction enzyme R subunit